MKDLKALINILLSLTLSLFPTTAPPAPQEVSSGQCSGQTGLVFVYCQGLFLCKSFLFLYLLLLNLLLLLFHLLLLFVCQSHCCFQ